MSYHLAQINIARMKAPLADPVMASFVEQLDEINALAEQSPGFVWRLKDDDGAETSFRMSDDDKLPVNMSVWKSIEALHAYAYRSKHVGVFRSRKQCFEAMTTPHMALWWIPDSTLPTLQEAGEKLAFLEHNGPKPAAFTFAHPFPAPALPDEGA